MACGGCGYSRRGEGVMVWGHWLSGFESLAIYTCV